MIITTSKKLVGTTAAAGVLLLALAGCGSAPEATPSSAAPSSGAIEGFLPCIVSGVGVGFEDKSFNQLGLAGLESAAETLGVESKSVVSNAITDFTPNIENLIGQGCTLVTTVGFDQDAATLDAATKNPDLAFVAIDSAVDADFDGVTDAENIKPILFDTAQAAFMAGYASASYSSDKSKKVGTFGGRNYSTVAIFMDGFAQGVEYWNAQKDDTVEVLGWDIAAQDGLFTDEFVPGAKAENAAQGLIDQGVDVILPVGGSIYTSAATKIRESGRDIALLGVDADVFETDPTVGDLLLTSILKAVDVGVNGAVVAAGEGNFDPTPFIGTLDNDGVGIAPFHDFESKVSPDLQGELDEIRAGIIDGSIPVTSYLAG